MIFGFGLLRRGALVVLACLAGLGLALPATTAAKSVTVGQLFTPTTGCGNATFLQTVVASGNSYTVPKSGVITSWSFQDAAEAVSGLQLKVARAATSSDYTIVGQATAGTQTLNTVTTYKTHIPVKADDLIGLYTSGTGPCANFTGNSADINIFAPGDQAPGTETSYSSGPGYKLPISVTVALDCVVPNLKGETLRTAKKALKAHSCTLGNVRPKGQTKGKVASQNPAAGKTLAPGARVSVRLG